MSPKTDVEKYPLP